MTTIILCVGIPVVFVFFCVYCGISNERRLR